MEGDLPLLKIRWHADGKGKNDGAINLDGTIRYRNPNFRRKNA